MLPKWYYYLDISDYEKAQFFRAMNGKCDYNPISVARMDDLRYRYLCHTVPYDSNPVEFAILELYKPRNGYPYITKIMPVNLDI